jgi:hypothetical protein
MPSLIMPGEWPRVVIPIAMMMASERTGGQRQHRQTDHSRQHVFLGCQRPIPLVHSGSALNVPSSTKCPKTRNFQQIRTLKEFFAGSPGTMSIPIKPKTIPNRLSEAKRLLILVVGQTQHPARHSVISARHLRRIPTPLLFAARAETFLADQSANPCLP